MRPVAQGAGSSGEHVRGGYAQAGACANCAAGGVRPHRVPRAPVAPPRQVIRAGIIRLAALLSLALLVGGCASTEEKAEFRLGLDASAATRRLMWPPESAGEVPRYFYVGELTGENNFVKPAAETGALKSAIVRLFDILAGETPPLLLDRPQSGVVDESGRILVTDMGRAGVFVFDEAQGRLAVWDKAAGATPFIAPVGIAIGPAGDVFVADPELSLVAHLDRDGKTLAPIGKGQLQRPTGLAFEADSRRLFVSDTRAHQVKVFDPEGTLLSTVGEPGEEPGQFKYPTFIAVAHGKLYVSDTLNARVQVISTATGRYLGSVGNRGLFVGNLVRPKGVAADSEDNVYVIESYFDYMLVYNRRGKFLMPIGGVGGGPGNFHLPAGIWVDARNRVFVADMLNRRVAVFQFLGGDDHSEEQ
jgi:DNA-binding beta-propeller fold protein YncE